MGTYLSKPKHRVVECDIIRGILIIVVVVVGHSGEDVLHDIIFLFHMPLFFMLSGFLVEENVLIKKDYVSSKMKRLIPPYLVYLLMDFLIVRRDYSVSSFLHALYGGCALSGVYWYITCFLFTLFLFRFLLNRFPDKTIQRLDHIVV